MIVPVNANARDDKIQQVNIDRSTKQSLLIGTPPMIKRQINITAAAKIRPLVIQSLFMRVKGDPPSEAELNAFCDRLNEITAAGGKLKLIQVYTVARQPAESYVAPLTDAEVDKTVELVQQRTQLPAKAFYGAST